MSKEIFCYTCRHCGAKFSTQYPRARYCCRECRQAAKDERERTGKRGPRRGAQPACLGCYLSAAERTAHQRAVEFKLRERRAMLERLAARDREYAAWAGERGKPRVRDFRPKDIHGIAAVDMRRWY